MKRIVYYIIHCSAEENQDGTFHHSKPFKVLALARQASTKIKDDFVAIEKHHEYFRGVEYKPECQWEIDHEAGGVEQVE